ncbi:LysE family translocator [Candidatus Entotheonella palauensis]|uniref:Uncharacterized protein n=1 Tax=Candidatus Entotheonella gemina TaxID=1429439 RepID=W4LGB8_9BACT|nr:LysE family translocator [Candidatus Entotheonella palauensis]ETW96934.1 MAG: hypothetical protein ETSY2_45515 [Candidatus Entotheonella gemina]
MDFWQGLMTLTLIHLLAAAAPGPDFALVTRQSLVYGRQAGLLVSLGISLGLAIHITYSAAGLAAAVAHSATWMKVIKLGGGIFLLYLGIKGLRAQPQSPTQNGSGLQHLPASATKQVLTGFLCNALNPKAPIYFLSLFTLVLSPNMPWLTVAIYGMWIMVLQLFWFSAVTLFFTHTSIRTRFLAIGHWIDRAFGVAMVALGIRVLTASDR